MTPRHILLAVLLGTLLAMSVSLLLAWFGEPASSDAAASWSLPDLSFALQFHKIEVSSGIAPIV